MKKVEAWAIVETDNDIRCGVFGPRTILINNYVKHPAHRGMRLVRLLESPPGTEQVVVAALRVTAERAKAAAKGFHPEEWGPFISASRVLDRAVVNLIRIAAREKAKAKSKEPKRAHRP